MKRLLSLSLIIILVFSCFSGCSSGDSKEETEGQTTASIELTIENATKFLDIDVNYKYEGGYAVMSNVYYTGVSSTVNIEGYNGYTFNDVSIEICCSFSGEFVDDRGSVCISMLDAEGSTKLESNGNGIINANGQFGGQLSGGCRNMKYLSYEITDISGTVMEDN